MPQISTSAKRNPVGISSSMFKASGPAYPSLSCNRPLNLPFSVVPIRTSFVLSTGTRTPDSDKLSKFGSCVIIFLTCTRSDVSVFMVREVIDCGNLQRVGVHPPSPNKDILSTFVNHRVYLKNKWSEPPVDTRRSLTYWAGLSSGTRNNFDHP